MTEIARSVRISIGLGPADAGEPLALNTFGGWPTVDGLFAWFEIVVRCRGNPDPATGYLVNIADIDRAVRAFAYPIIARAVRHRSKTGPGVLLSDVLDALSAPLVGLMSSVEWRLSPYHSLTMAVSSRDCVLVSETFEFAAAHRLNCADLSESENRDLFGKCNNPSGHGHNYQVEVSVAVPLSPGGDLAVSRTDLQRIVNERIIERFDHKNLDLDTAEFAKINSSVENIARTCFEILDAPIGELGGTLRCITVWETGKTCATYPADALSAG